MRFAIVKILRGEFFKNFLKIFTGNSIAQIAPLIFTPIFARVFTTEDYGQLAIFATVTIFVGTLASFRYELAIVPVKKDTEASIIYALCIGANVLVATISSIVCVFLYFVYYTNTILFYIPLGILLSGMYNLVRMRSVRKKEFTLLTISLLAGVIIGIATKFFWGFFNYDSNGLVYSLLCTKLVTLMVLFKGLLKVRKMPSLSSLRKVRKKHISLPLYNLPQVLLDSIQNHGLILFLSTFFSQSLVGQYYMAARFVGLPASYLGSALSPVFYQRISQKINEGEHIYKFTLKFILVLFLIGLPIFMTFLLFGPSIFEIFLGKKWSLAGTLASYLSIWMLLKFVTSPISQIPIIFNQNRRFLLFTFVYNVSLLLAFLTSIYFNLKIDGTFILVSALGTLVLIAANIWIVSLTKNNL